MMHFDLESRWNMAEMNDLMPNENWNGCPDAWKSQWKLKMATPMRDGDNELRRADHEVHDIADGRYDGRIQKYQQGLSI